MERKTPLCGKFKVRDVEEFWKANCTKANESKEECLDTEEDCLDKCAQKLKDVGAELGCCQFIAVGSKHRFEEKIPNTCWFIQGSGVQLKELKGKKTFSHALAMFRSPDDDEDEQEDNEDSGTGGRLRGASR